MTELTIEEVESDLAATDRDIERLERITRDIRAFISDSQGEDRSAFKMDAFKYSGLESQARRLRENIMKAKARLQGGAIAPAPRP